LKDDPLLRIYSLFLLCLAVPALSFAGVSTSAPLNGSTVGSPTRFIASATSPNGPIASMTINVDSKDVYKTFTSSLNTSVALASGSHSVIMKAWDTKGNYFQQVLSIAVTSSNTAPTPAGKNVVSNIEDMTGWQSCSACAGPGGNGINTAHSLTQGVKSPSLDGASGQFWLGGTHPYTNALFFKPLGGRAGATHFILDFDFWIGNATVAQGLEFDIFYSRDGFKNYFLTECDSRGTYAGTWQVSNVVIDTWQHTGLPCHVNSFAWNHVTLEFYRQPDGNTRFVSVSMNGNLQYVNRTYPALKVNSFEMNAAVQLDGDEKQDDFSIWVDRMKITYW
jgi:hypothetical protein